MNRAEYVTIRKSLMSDGLFRKSNTRAFVTTTTELIVMAAIIYGLWLVELFSPGYWILQALLGLSLFRCFVLTHECGHGTLFGQKSLNTMFGTLFGCLCAVPYLCWRNAHFEHHKWVGVVDKDPTSVGLLSIKEYGPIMRNLLLVLWKLRIPLAALGGVVAAFWMYPFKQWRAGNTSNALYGAISTLITAAALVGLVVLLGESALAYIAPAFIFFYIFFECINLTHHSGLYPYISDSHPDAVPLHEQDSHCRTALMPPWLSAITCYHFNLHTEHHLFPAVPWHNLPEVQKRLSDTTTGNITNVEMFSFMNEIRSKDPFQAFVDSVPNRTV
ncbi:MAG: fatty acid desaturase [Ketobacteraceae bacterium]|nr:fatty acid desaturase [Ketobacteraceae bacterium]